MLPHKLVVTAVAALLMLPAAAGLRQVQGQRRRRAVEVGVRADAQRQARFPVLQGEAALELHTQCENGTKMPSWLCNGDKKRELGPVTEVGFNALHTRLKADMPNTQTFVSKHRPEGTNSLYVAWDTLTHANNPN